MSYVGWAKFAANRCLAEILLRLNVDLWEWVFSEDEVFNVCTGGIVALVAAAVTHQGRYDS